MNQFVAYMALKTQIIPHTLDFRFPAGTSRGVLREKKINILKVWDDDDPDRYGLGECGPLSKLSIDDHEDIDELIKPLIKQLEGTSMPKSIEEIYKMAIEISGFQFPSLRFCIETALLDLRLGGKRKIFDNDFFNKQSPMPINGLIWMGHMEAMLLQISDKVAEGFDCIKMKVGSLDFEKEVDILNYIRRKYYDKQILLRVDANGAFKPEEALYKMEAMARHDIHSIEQPIKAGQYDLMASICEKRIIDVALDEELIGVNKEAEKRELLDHIKPQYIILKPNLLGGFKSCDEWIKLAEKRNIGWWMTSALESNIGLNAICQYTMEKQAKSYQGLGTGKLYHNNIDSPLTIKSGTIFYDAAQAWGDVEIQSDEIV